MLIFDCETDGFLAEMSRIHCLHMGDPATGDQWRYSDTKVCNLWHGTLEQGLERLAEEDEIGGHNVFRFDILAIRKVFPDWEPKGYVWDTLALSCLAYPKDELKKIDGKKQKAGEYPPHFYKKGYFAGQQLGAWGYRLGELKTEYEGGFDTFTLEMDDYCAQDVTVNIKLWNKVWERLEKDGVPKEAAIVENEVLRIIASQETRGFCFNEDAARELECELLVRKAELDAELRKAFKPWIEPQRKYGKPVRKVAQRKVRVRRWDENYEEYYIQVQKGEEYELQQLIMFNPASRAHIANRLQTLYGWKPKVFTNSGQPEISEETLDGMEFPEAPLLKEYLMIDKRIGMLSSGKQAWLIHLKDDGRIHGRVNTNQAVTGRMTHSFPNVAQVPSCGAPYGKECRSLFGVPEGYRLVGCDAEGLELRCLGHFMAKYDGGAYADTVVNGDKSKGTDVHTVNQKVVGLNTRDAAKTFIYALVYGGGDAKLGEIIVADMPDEKRHKWLASTKDKDKGYRILGARSRMRMMEGLPALGKLVDAVQRKVRKQKFIRGIDGRKLPIRKAHAALNTLLQSAGALVMKKALVLMEEEYRKRGWIVLWSPDGDCMFVANVHDEVQIESKEDIAEQVAQIAEEAVFRAGEEFGFRCPLAGSSDIGATWAETH